MTLEGKTFLFLGGATSTDRMFRKEHVSWFSEEHITYSDICNSLDSLDRYQRKVDYVLTHCAPTPVVRSMFRVSGDEDTDQLEGLRQTGFEFSYWYFGHYHADQSYGIFRCFYNDILKLE